MWHEARRQEKFIRNVMVDVKKRAERRKDFYERIRQDPIRFLRLYGSKAKLNIDPEVAIAAENPSTLMPWVGDNKTIIDRFDVRANLQRIDEKKTYIPTTDEKLEERMCNYESYRCLVHNHFAKISENVALGKIEVTEKYGEDLHKVEKQMNSKKKNNDKAAIGYVYADTDYTHNPNNSDDSESCESEPDLEMDLDIELDVGELSFTQQKDITRVSHVYGMRGNDYLKLMKLDKTQEEEFRTAKLLEEQKAQFHGRKSRRERKIFKEQRLREKYMKQDPKTLSFGASVFHEELFVGKDLLTPSPERQIEPLDTQPTKQSTSTTITPSSLKPFINLPTIHDDNDISSRSRSRSGSSGVSNKKRYSTQKKYRESNKKYGPSLPTTTTTSNSLNTSFNSNIRKRSRSIDDDKRRHLSPISKRNLNQNRRYGEYNRSNRSRDNSRNNWKKYKTQRKDSSDQDLNHGYDLSLQRSPEVERRLRKSPQISEEEMLKKKYYKSESDKNSDSSDYSSSGSESSSEEEYRRKESSSRMNKSTGNYGSSYSGKSINPINDKVDKIASKFNPQEFLKKQMEKQLNRTYREDKKAEQERQQKMEKERMDRENQLREMAVQIRKREREKDPLEPLPTTPNTSTILVTPSVIRSQMHYRGTHKRSSTSTRSSHSRSRTRSKSRSKSRSSKSRSSSSSYHRRSSVKRRHGHSRNYSSSHNRYSSHYRSSRSPVKPSSSSKYHSRHYSSYRR